MGLSGRVPPRVDQATKAGLLDLLEQACGRGWTVHAACQVLEAASCVSTGGWVAGPPTDAKTTPGVVARSPAAIAWARSGPGHHAAVGRPIGECLVIDVADRTAGTTTIVCRLITIQRVR